MTQGLTAIDSEAHQNGSLSTANRSRGAEHHPAQRHLNHCLLVSGDDNLSDQIQAVAVTSAVELRRYDDLNHPDIERLWHSAVSVLIAADLLTEFAALGLPARSGVTLIGSDQQSELLCLWSQPLAATTLTLPAGIHWISAALQPKTDDNEKPHVVAVSGATGGIGATTTAAGIAGALSQASARPTVLIDLDFSGPGIELIVGTEQVGGYRWRDLSELEGNPTAVWQNLPKIGNLSVLSHVRGASQQPTISAVNSVIRTLSRANIVIDLGREESDRRRSILARCDHALLVCGDQLHQIAGAQQQLIWEQDLQQPWQLILRRNRGFNPGTIVDLLKRQPVAELITDKSLAELTDQGRLPHQFAGSKWRKSIRALAETISS